MSDTNKPTETANAVADRTELLSACDEALKKIEDKGEMEKLLELIEKRVGKPNLSAFGTILQAMAQEMAKPYIDAVEAAGFSREDFYEWLFSHREDWSAYQERAQKAAAQFEGLPPNEYIQKLQAIETKLYTDACLTFLRERKEKETAEKCLCTALAPRLTESFPASLNNYQSLEKILAMESGRELTLQINGASLTLQRLTGDPLSEADKMVLFATCHVAQNNTVFYPLLGKHVPFAGFLDVAAQMKGGRVKTGSGLYEAVVQSLARLTTSKYFFDYSDLVSSPDLKEQAISAEEQALIEGRRVEVRATNGKKKAGIFFHGSWVMKFLARAGNPGVFNLSRKYLADIRIDGPEDLEMFARIMKRATGSAPNQNKQRLYAAGRPEEEQTFFKACGLLDVSTIAKPTSSQTSKDTRQRQKLEGMLSCLKETGDFSVSLEREGRNKKLVAFEVRFLGRDQPTIEGRDKRKTHPRGGKKGAQN